MRGLIIVLILISVSLTIVAVNSQMNYPSIFLTILILPVILSTYFDSPKISLSVVITCCFIVIASLLAAFRPYFVTAAIISFYVVYIVAKRGKDEFAKVQEKFTNDIKDKKRKYQSLIEENKKVKGYSRDIDQQTEELENLYEVTRRMSVYLKADEIFKILCSEIKNNFEFNDCRLINVQQTKTDKYQINNIYDIVTESKLKEPKEYDKKIVNSLCKEKQSLTITASEDNLKIKSYFNLPSNIVSLLAIPIIINDKVNNIVIIENLKEENFEKFSIVIGQFALEMKKVKLYEVVERLSTIDGLTSLLLRRNFMDSLDKELQRAKSHNLKLSALMIDIDHFKRLNDKYGHLAGDKVLARIAQIIKKNTRRIDLVSRYGGEEFTVALTETDKKGAVVVAERIREQIEKEEFQLDGKKVSTSVSIGIAFFPDNSRQVSELIDLSDKALYRAKRTGRNKIAIYKNEE